MGERQEKKVGKRKRRGEEREEKRTRKGDIQ